MEAGNYNFTIQEGVFFTVGFAYKDANGDPIPISRARLQIKPRKGAEAIITMDTDEGTLDYDGDSGMITPMLTDVQTTGLEINEAVYDVKVWPLDGKSKRILEGSVTYSRQVTV